MLVPSFNVAQARARSHSRFPALTSLEIELPHHLTTNLVPAANMASTKFRVIIVGGGVSGLTLANALEKAQVEYVLLESKGEFAPVSGASIALGPPGNRIMDQLGCCENAGVWMSDRVVLT
jgi:hypothetical protein